MQDMHGNLRACIAILEIEEPSIKVNDALASLSTLEIAIDDMEGLVASAGTLSTFMLESIMCAPKDQKNRARIQAKLDVFFGRMIAYVASGCQRSNMDFAIEARRRVREINLEQ